MTHLGRLFVFVPIALASLLDSGAGQAAPPSGPSSTPPGSSIIYAPGGGSFTTPPPTTPPTPSGTSVPGGAPGAGTSTLPFDFKVPAAPPGQAIPQVPPAVQLGFPLMREDTIEPGQLVVAYNAQAAKADIEQFARRYGIRPAEIIELPALGWTLAVYQLPNNALAGQLRFRLMREQPKLRADFNMRYAASGKPRLYSRTSIGLSRTDAPRAGHGVRVGMLDGPVEGASVLDVRKLVTRNLLAPSERPAAAAHASAVAALIAGRDPANEFFGIAPAAELYAGVIMRSRSGVQDTTTRSVIAGLDWLLQARAQIINLSLGGPPNRVLAAAVFAALERSVLIVAAAGNDGAGAEPTYPAAYPGVIAVTATDAGDQIYEHANRGSYITISAPGVDVWTPGGTTGQYVSGTSYACAIVTGAVALTLSIHRDVAPKNVQARLCETAKDLGTPGNDPVFGCGLLQMKDILSAAR